MCSPWLVELVDEFTVQVPGVGGGQCEEGVEQALGQAEGYGHNLYKKSLGFNL